MTPVTQQAASIDMSLSQATDTIHNIESSRSFAKSFHITTMTLLLYLGPFNFGRFLEHCTTSDSSWSINCSPKFYNCIFFSRRINSTKKMCIKVFRNGKLHITGLGCVAQAVEFGQEFCTMLQPFAESTLVVSQLDVQLMNGTFKFALAPGTCLCLKTMQILIKSLELSVDVPVTCLFNNDYHSAFKIKFQFETNTATVLVFESGSVLLQSYRTSQQLLTIYTAITNFVTTHMEQLTKELVRLDKKRKRNFDYSVFI